jgi:hypothetical protein
MIQHIHPEQRASLDNVWCDARCMYILSVCPPLSVFRVCRGDFPELPGIFSDSCGFTCAVVIPRCDDEGNVTGVSSHVASYLLLSYPPFCVCRCHVCVCSLVCPIVSNHVRKPLKTRPSAASTPNDAAAKSH